MTFPGLHRFAIVLVAVVLVLVLTAATATATASLGQWECDGCESSRRECNDSGDDHEDHRVIRSPDDDDHHVSATAAAASGEEESPWYSSPPIPTTTTTTMTTPMTTPTPTSAGGEARLIIVHITDVYTLENLPSVKTMLGDLRAGSPDAKVVSVLTGDFLSPYLLSSVDDGRGMMDALSKVPVDYLTFGNHEADIDQDTLRRHVREFPGTWINSNIVTMAVDRHDHDDDHDHDHHDDAIVDRDEGRLGVPFEIVDVVSPDGRQTRRVGFVAVLSDDASLYDHFDPPGAFGGATVRDPWEALAEYKSILEGHPHRCDVIVPLQHLYLPDDRRTCDMFDVPLVLSGHDHHPVDEVVNGTRILKPGLDAIRAVVAEIRWRAEDDEDDEDEDQAAFHPRRPEISARIVRTDWWEPDPELREECARAYDALIPLRDTELSRVPPAFEPLSSAGARGAVTTMGRFLCTLLRLSLNDVANRRRRRLGRRRLGRRRQQKDQRRGQQPPPRDAAPSVDAVLLMGGNVRAGVDYPRGGFFSLEALEAEIKSDEVVGIVPMPGWVLARSISETHGGDPIPGWIQYDNLVREERSTGWSSEEKASSGGSPASASSEAASESRAPRSVVTHVGGAPLDPLRIYRVATKISDLTNGQSPTWTEYYTAHPEALPPPRGEEEDEEDASSMMNIRLEVLSYLARNHWRRLCEASADADANAEERPRNRNDDGDDGENIHGAEEEEEGRKHSSAGVPFDVLDLSGDGTIDAREIRVGLRDWLNMSIHEDEPTLAEYIVTYADTDGDGIVTRDDVDDFRRWEMPRLSSRQEAGKWKLSLFRPGRRSHDDATTTTTTTTTTTNSTTATTANAMMKSSPTSPYLTFKRSCLRPSFGEDWT